ncbi:G-protein gamma subunit [Armillaria mellea]|nr:G-protein gamma subunit [Armillaria mellea]
MNARPHKVCLVDLVFGTLTNRNYQQSMSELKLRRLTEHNQRLREDLARPRVRVSEASASLIRYCKTTKDHLVPSVWGPVGKGEDPYAPPAQGCSCVVM